MSALKPEQLINWAERARPGENVAYFTGTRPGDAVRAVASALHSQGLVTMTTKRATDGATRHILQRLAAPRPSKLRALARINPGRFQSRADGAKCTTKAVLRLLTRAANRGQACPTNAELARALGLKDAVAASYRVRRLVRENKIRVEEPGPTERRVVTIVATGKSTVRGAL